MKEKIITDTAERRLVARWHTNLEVLLELDPGADTPENFKPEVYLELIFTDVTDLTKPPMIIRFEADEWRRIDNWAGTVADESLARIAEKLGPVYSALFRL